MEKLRGWVDISLSLCLVAIELHSLVERDLLERTKFLILGDRIAFDDVAYGHSIKNSTKRKFTRLKIYGKLK